MKNNFLTLAGAALCSLFITSLPAFAQGTAFTYQGRLDQNGAPASGLYDLRFRLFVDPFGNTQTGSAVVSNAVSVASGLFTVSLDFGAGIFNGSNFWLEVDVKTNNAGVYVNLNPLQALTPAPYAIFAAKSGGGGLAAGTYGSAVTFNNPADQFTGAFTGAFTGNGVNLTNVNAATLGGLSPASFWKTSGNSGTSPTNGNFLGTTDDQPLELRVNGQRALRLEPNTNGAPNLIGGATSNFVDPGIVGATIAGGGAVNYMGSPSSNHIAAIFGTIGGGRLNTVSADHGTIAGGLNNTIQANGSTGAAIAGGFDNNAAGQYSTVGGGFANNAIGYDGSTVSGGEHNSAVAYATTVGGGTSNRAGGFGLASFATVGGGYRNSASGHNATVGGGAYNTASGYSATVGGGFTNTASGDYSFAAGRRANALHTGAFVWGDSLDQDITSTTSNQFSVRATGGVRFVTAGAGISVDGQPVPLPQATVNDANHSNIVNVVNGSAVNFVSAGTVGATIAGGGAAYYFAGAAFSNGVTADFGTISGGVGNLNHGQYGTLSGGYFNMIGLGAAWATVGGGDFNLAAGLHSTVGGGNFNRSIGNFATVPGGVLNSAGGKYSFAAGRRAKADWDGGFVWADSQDADFAATGNDQFLIRAAGGVGIGTASPQTALHVLAPQGSQLRLQDTADNFYWNIYTESQNASGNLLFVSDSGAYAWFSRLDGAVFHSSDARLKKDITPLGSVLDRVLQLRPVAYHFRSAPKEAPRTFGLIAQEVEPLFPEVVGEHEGMKGLAYGELVPVTIRAVQELNQKLTDELQRRDAENADLKHRLDKLEQLLNSKNGSPR